MASVGIEALEELARALAAAVDPSEIRRAALAWAIRWTGAADGAFLAREPEGWRCRVAWGDPGPWEGEWGMPPEEAPRGWTAGGTGVWLLAIPKRGAVEWLGLRDPGPAALAKASFWAVAGLLIGIALGAAEERERRNAFLSTAVHELRLPMTSLKGYADLLLKGLAGPLTENQRRFLGTIRANVDRLAGLVSDLLEHARLEAGRLRLRIEPVSLREALEGALRNVQGEIEGRGHRVSVELAEDLPSVAADRERLVVILTKVLDNAAKYTPPGGEIRVRARREGSVVLCEVADNGIGIAEGERRHLFTPFWRSEDPRVREVPGFGLSLAVARGLLEAMGGGIEVESAAGRGTRVRIRVPAASPEGEGQ